MSMAWIGVGSAVVGGGLNYMASREANRGQGGQGYQYGYGGNYGSNTGQTGSASWGLNTWTPHAGLDGAYRNLNGLISNLSNTPSQFYPGQTYAGMSGQTGQGLGLLESTMGDYQSGAAAMRNAAGQMQPYLDQQWKNYNFLSNAADVANNPYVQGQIAANERSTMDTLQRQMLPQLQSGSVGVNNLGSSRLGLAQGQALGDASKGLANTNAAYLSQAYQQGLNAQQAALGMTGNLMNNTMLPGQAYGAAGSMLGQGAANMLQAGSIREGFDQKKIDDARARWEFSQNEPWQRANNLSSLLNGLQYTGESRSSQSGYGTSSNQSWGNNYTQTPYQNQNYMNPYQAALGGASLGYGVYDQWRRGQASGGGSGGSGGSGSYNPWWGGGANAGSDYRNNWWS